jgi:hypothetical protein
MDEDEMSELFDELRDVDERLEEESMSEDDDEDGEVDNLGLTPKDRLPRAGDAEKVFSFVLAPSGALSRWRNITKAERIMDEWDEGGAVSGDKDDPFYLHPSGKAPCALAYAVSLPPPETKPSGSEKDEAEEENPPVRYDVLDRANDCWSTYDPTELLPPPEAHPFSIVKRGGIHDLATSIATIQLVGVFPLIFETAEHMYRLAQDLGRQTKLLELLDYHNVYTPQLKKKYLAYLDYAYRLYGRFTELWVTGQQAKIKTSMMLTAEKAVKQFQEIKVHPEELSPMSEGSGFRDFPWNSMYLDSFEIVAATEPFDKLRIIQKDPVGAWNSLVAIDTPKSSKHDLSMLLVYMTVLNELGHADIGEQDDVALGDILPGIESSTGYAKLPVISSADHPAADYGWWETRRTAILGELEKVHVRVKDRYTAIESETKKVLDRVFMMPRTLERTAAYQLILNREMRKKITLSFPILSHEETANRAIVKVRAVIALERISADVMRYVRKIQDSLKASGMWLFPGVSNDRTRELGMMKTEAKAFIDSTIAWAKEISHAIKVVSSDENMFRYNVAGVVDGRDKIFRQLSALYATVQPKIKQQLAELQQLIESIDSRPAFMKAEAMSVNVKFVYQNILVYMNFYMAMLFGENGRARSQARRDLEIMQVGWEYEEETTLGYEGGIFANVVEYESLKLLFRVIRESRRGNSFTYITKAAFEKSLEKLNAFEDGLNVMVKWPSHRLAEFFFVELGKFLNPENKFASYDEYIAEMQMIRFENVG